MWRTGRRREWVIYASSAREYDRATRPNGARVGPEQGALIHDVSRDQSDPFAPGQGAAAMLRSAESIAWTSARSSSSSSKLIWLDRRMVRC